MQSVLLIAIILFAQNNGYLTVNTDKPGVNVYLEGDLIGTTPITNYSTTAGEYSVSLYDSKIIENEYWNLRNATLFRKLSSLWQLIRIDAATKQVNVIPNKSIKVSFYTTRINRAPTLAKCALGGSILGIFGLGILTGVLIAHWAN
jgi:PEGA domain